MTWKDCSKKSQEVFILEYLLNIQINWVTSWKCYFKSLHIWDQLVISFYNFLLFRNILNHCHLTIRKIEKVSKIVLRISFLKLLNWIMIVKQILICKCRGQNIWVQSKLTLQKTHLYLRKFSIKDFQNLSNTINFPRLKNYRKDKVRKMLWNGIKRHKLSKN